MKYYKPVYAYTCYKAQGETINEPYNIYDCDKMSFREMLVSISRGTNFDDVYLDYDLIKDKIFEIENCDDMVEETKLIQPKIGYIYIECILIN